MVSNKILLYLLLCLVCFSTIALSDDPDCVYSLYIRTGSIFKAGTDSIISVRLYDVKGYYLEIKNIEKWGGLMGPDYNYFERKNLDIFSGRGTCLTAPICGLKLISDGSGPHHGWYCNYVEVTTTGVHGGCSQKSFTIEQWLATDASPYKLTAVRNDCPYKIPDDDQIKVSADGRKMVRGVNDRGSVAASL